MRGQSDAGRARLKHADDHGDEQTHILIFHDHAI